MRLKRLFFGVMLLAGITNVGAMEHSLGDVSTSISLKVPGNDAQHYSLTLQKQQDGIYTCQSSEQLPLVITRQIVDKDGKQRINVVIKDLDTVILIASSTCPVSGTARIFVLPKRPLLSIPQIAGWYAKTV